MADDSIHESERRFLHALRPNFSTQRRYIIEYFESSLDQLFDDYEIYLRSRLLKPQSPMLYLNMTIRKFGQLSVANYTPPMATYEALDAAGLTISDIDMLINEWPHYCMVLEDEPGRFVLVPKKRLSDGDSIRARYLCHNVFPFADQLIREQIENYHEASDISELFDLLAGLFCSSYQWLTIQTALDYLHQVIEVHVNGVAPAPAKTEKVRKVRYQPFHSFGYRLADANLLLQLCRSLNRQFDFIDLNQTTPEDFAALLSTRRLDDVSAVIHFACETTQVAYVLTILQPYFQRLSFQNVERTGRFFSHLGRPLTANNLSKSKSENPKEKDFIDSTIRDIFKHF